MGGTIDSNDCYIKLSMIGDSLQMLKFFLSREIYNITKAKDKKEKKSIFDFWDYEYRPWLSFDAQINEVFNSYQKLKEDYETNIKECLIVRIKDKKSKEVDKIFCKIEKTLKKPYFMPLVLFLCDNYSENEKDNKIKPDPEKYPNIDPDTIYTESFIEEKEYKFESIKSVLTEIGEHKMEKIKYTLLRVCTYCNDLGDKFSIGEGDLKMSFDLNEKSFQYTVNICCIGRTDKGKSTCVNCILGEKKARESKSGASVTKKMNFYQVNDYPIKIYDIPGFESQESVNNAIMKIDEINDETKKLQGQIHVLIYLIKSTDGRKFTEIEYNLFRKISEQKKSALLYVLTHSSLKTNKEEEIEKINICIKDLLKKHRKEEGINKEIFNFMKAKESNCVLINFHPENDTPIFGINELFKRISELAKESNIFRSFKENNLSEEDHHKELKNKVHQNFIENAIKYFDSMSKKIIK